MIPPDGLLRRGPALHVAIMRRHGVDEILTFDSGFDVIGDLRRRPG